MQNSEDNLSFLVSTGWNSICLSGLSEKSHQSKIDLKNDGDSNK
jgi:hypothetical protein